MQNSHIIYPFLISQMYKIKNNSKNELMYIFLNNVYDAVFLIFIYLQNFKMLILSKYFTKHLVVWNKK